MRNLKSKLTLIFVLFLAVFVADNRTQNTTDDTPIKVRTVLLNLPIVVNDKSGRNLTGLKKDDFTIFQDGEKQSIEYFADAEAPMSVAIVMDTSQSTATVLSSIKKVARDFVFGFGPEDQAMIVSFNHKVTVLSSFTSDKKKLKNVINDVYTTDGDGLDNMYDVIYEIVTKDFAAVKGRKTIIVLTDGIVGGSQITKESLIDKLSESDVLVYPIFYYVGPQRGFTIEKLSKWPRVEFLRSMASVTGGRLYIAAAEDFDSSLRQISEDLKKYYVVGFYPPEGRGSNNLQIKVNRDDVTVRTKGTIRLKTPIEDKKK